METWISIRGTPKSMLTKALHRYVTVVTNGASSFCNTKSYTIISFLVKGTNEFSVHF